MDEEYAPPAPAPIPEDLPPTDRMDANTYRMFNIRFVKEILRPYARGDWDHDEKLLEKATQVREKWLDIMNKQREWRGLPHYDFSSRDVSHGSA